MRLTSILAIYLLFWVMSAYFLLPFGVRTHEDDHLPKIPGQAGSAPTQFRPGPLAVRATVLATVLMALFYANYTHGWIRAAQLDVTRFIPGEPPAGR